MSQLISLSRIINLSYEDAAQTAIIAGSNHFEVAIAGSTIILGIRSGAYSRNLSGSFDGGSGGSNDAVPCLALQKDSGVYNKLYLTFIGYLAIITNRKYLPGNNLNELKKQGPF